MVIEGDPVSTEGSLKVVGYLRITTPDPPLPLTATPTPSNPQPPDPPPVPVLALVVPPVVFPPLDPP